MCESRGGRPVLPSQISRTAVTVDVKQHFNNIGKLKRCVCSFMSTESIGNVRGGDRAMYSGRGLTESRTDRAVQCQCVRGVGSSKRYHSASMNNASPAC